MDREVNGVIGAARAGLPTSDIWKEEERIYPGGELRAICGHFARTDPPNFDAGWYGFSFAYSLEPIIDLVALPRVPY